MARVDAAGKLVVGEDGRVEMVYREGGQVYRAAPGNLKLAGGGAKSGARGGAAGEGPEPPAPKVVAPAAQALRPGPAGTIEAWTDGACLKNPGPCGAGVLLIHGDGQREIARYLGRGTNNIGELVAIELALMAIGDPTQPVTVYTDSAYSLGVLTKPWKPKKNVELIERIKVRMKAFRRLRVAKVPGHSGVAANERVDELARSAASQRRDLDQSTGTVPPAPKSPRPPMVL